jgi:hypothetical protein
MVDMNAPEASVKWETRHRINEMADDAYKCFTGLPNIQLYESGHKKVDWIEATLCGYIFSDLAQIKFDEIRKAFEQRKAKLRPSVRRNKSSEYLDLIYSFNLKRYKYARKLMSKAGLEIYKKKVVARL